MEKKLADHIFEWMTKFKQTSIKASSYDRLITSLDLFRKHKLADILLDDLTEEALQDYINDLRDGGYALSTIKKQYNLVTGFLRFANAKGIFSRPIYENVRLPSQSMVLKESKDVVAYDISQQARLRKVLETGEMTGYYAALMMMETGMRIGECLALTWADIDWTRRAIRINKTFVRLGNRCKQFVQNEAKSFASNRVIPMSQNALQYLTRLKGCSDGNMYIFHTDDGQPLSYEAMRYQITKACGEADVPYFGQHVFRHTFATNCYNRGCDVKILSKLLGHSNVTITYNIYIHLFGDALEEMRKVLV